jgi:hypothetical protein
MVKDASNKRQRSPDYPFYSLPECVKYIEALKKKEGLVKLPKITAFKDMGFDPTGQRVWRASSAITGFGLLEEEGPQNNRMFKFTDLGRTIVLIKDNNEQQKLAALQKAALNYEIIKQIRAVWDQGLPASDDVIKTELIRRGFNERAAGRFVVVLRETYDYARLGGSAVSEEPGSEDGAGANLDIREEFRKQMSSLTQRTPEKTLLSKGYEEYTLSLSWGKEVKLLTSEALTKADIDFMLMWIKRLDLGRAEPTQRERLDDEGKDEAAQKPEENY